MSTVRRVQLLLVLALGLLSACASRGEPTGAGTQPGIAGTRWMLTSLDGGDLIEASVITLDFGPAHLGGFAGCNGYGGGYTATADGALSVDEIAVTAQGCLSPVGVMEQEAAYLRALHDATAYRVMGDRLEIADLGGEVRLVFARRVQAAMDPADLANTRWRLVSTDEGSPPGGAPYTLVLWDGGRLHGQAGCRGFVGGYQATEEGLSVYWLSMTDTEGCLGLGPLPPEEGQYLDALQGADSYLVDQDRLELTGLRGGELVFEPLAPGADLPLEGTEWRLVAWVEDRQATGLPGSQSMPTDVLPGSEITARYEGGEVSGSAGCNHYAGSYALQGDALTVGGLASTEMACMEPAGVMAQETLFLGRLREGGTYRIDGAQLWLEKGEGSALLFGVR